MNKVEKLADLRHFLAHYALPPDRPSIPLGLPETDAVLGGGLRRGAVHEVFAGDWAAGGFAACLAIRAAGKKPLFWIRPDYEALEYGALSATGLLELGGDPRNLFLLRAPDAADGLSAAADILACPHVGAVVLELCGAPRSLDLVASRRLALLAEENGVTLFVLREGAAPEPSAATTRWQVKSLASDPHDDDWGSPRFHARLTRHRLGGLGDFTLEWDSENGIFHQAAAHSGAVVSTPADRPAASPLRQHA
ncbi:MAG: DNA repair protein [Rhizomicrobium sp.]